MIGGVVSADREAIVRLILRAPDGRDIDVEFVIDTGFNGWITLPSTVILQLGLSWRRRGQGELADGSETVVDIYEADVIWDGALRRVPIYEMDSTPLIGMSFLDRHELSIQV
jgi:clan AA aspartic protease